MVEIESLSVSYNSHVALSDVSLRVGPGEFVLISGPSGCGKSTLALALAGLIPQAVPAQLYGRVVVDGLDTGNAPVHALARKVGIVFQNPATQLFNVTVEEEVGFAPRNIGLSAAEVKARVDEALEAVGIPHLRGRKLRALSGGEQQRVAIASVLSLRPRVLVLDEPTAHLDWRGVEQLLLALERLRREHGVTVILIEHRLAAVAQAATRVVLMDRGRIVADGAPGAILSDRSLLAMLGLRYPWCDVGRRVDPVGPAPRPHGDEPLVALRGVSAGYGKHRVLDGLDLALYPGQFVALVGENGAGKSTVARVLADIVRAERGKVEWHPSLRKLPVGRRVGLLFQNPLNQLVCDYVEEEVAYGPANYSVNADLASLFAAADLTELRRARTQNLSAGQQQRTALAAALALRPRLLILDEPTMGQDWAHLSRLMDYLTQLNDNGQAILLITHDDRLVCRYARRIVRMAEGRIVADGAVPATAPVVGPMEMAYVRT
ncbi:MAG: ATP-binding cassette domain-containing protein [Anaerolineales bacterium]